jgi:hypothetical protein
MVHAEDVIHSLERDVFPAIGSLPVREIDPPIVLSVLRPIEKRLAIETARRVRQRMSAVFVFGIANAKCKNDPTAIVKDAMGGVLLVEDGAFHHRSVLSVRWGCRESAKLNCGRFSEAHSPQVMHGSVHLDWNGTFLKLPETDEFNLFGLRLPRQRHELERGCCCFAHHAKRSNRFARTKVGK